MQSAAYWEKRALQREELSAMRAERLNRQIGRLYDRAMQDIKADMDKILGNYSAGRMSAEEALRRLNTIESRQELQRLRDMIEDITDVNERNRIIDRIDAPAYRARLTRLQALQDRIEVTLSKLTSESLKAQKTAYIEAQREAYYRTIYDTQMQTSLAFDFAMINERALQASLEHSWHGQDYSERVWKNTHVLAKHAKDIVQRGLIKGTDVRRMTAELQNEVGHARYASERVVRTELNFCHNQGDLAAYKEMDVKRYRFLATLDGRTCTKCGALDRTVHDLKDAVVGTTFPPIHPNDRCTTVSVISDDVTEGLQRRARDPQTGKTYLLPADTTYEQWKAQMEQKYGKLPKPGKSKKAQQLRNDKAQYERYKQRLGTAPSPDPSTVTVPASFEEFRKLKRSGSAEWNQLQLNYRFRGMVNRTLEQNPDYIINQDPDHPSESGAQALALAATDPEALAAIQRYTNPQKCRAINAYIAKGEVRSEEAVRDAHTLQKTLSTLSLEHNTVVFRGTQSKYFEGLDELIDSNIPISQWKNRELLTRALTSTSLYQKSAYKGDVQAWILTEKGKPGAGYLDPISYNRTCLPPEEQKSEYEVLLQCTSKYDIIEAQRFNKTLFLVLRWKGATNYAG